MKEEQTMKKTTLMLLALIVLSLFFVSGIAEKTEYVKTLFAANVRSGPTTNDDVIAHVDEGKTYELISKLDGWYCIRLEDGTEGYIGESRCRIIVTAETIEIDTDKAEVHAGKTITLIATVGPAEAEDKTVVWSTSDESVATVSSTGEVTGIARGEVDITAQVETGDNLIATQHITVIETGVCDNEIQFQGMEWGMTNKAARKYITDNGLIGQGTGENGGRPGYFWTENDVLLANTNMVKLTPQIIRENSWIGTFTENFFGIHKKIGGHEADQLSLAYINPVKDGKVDEKTTRLIGVRIVFTKKVDDESGAAIFFDLLTKLRSQYGEFKIYLRTDSRRSTRREENDEVEALVYEYCDDVTLFESDASNVSRVLAVMRGSNNTGIYLRWVNTDTIELTYAETDTYKYIEDIRQALEDAPDDMEDIGL